MFFLFAFWPIAVLAMVSWFIFLSCYGIQLPALSHLRNDRAFEYLPIPLQEYLFTDSLPVASDGMFLAAEDGHAIWEKTIKTVATDWPVIKTVPPDFESVPPRAGRIESAWVQLPQSLNEGRVIPQLMA